MEFELTTYIILWLIALLAGFVDAIAGGGGLLTVPALSFTSMDPAMILGTNKAQGVAGTFSSSLKFFRSKEITIREVFFAFCCSFFGAILGAITVQNIASNFLKPLILIMLIAIAIFFLVSPKLIDKKRPARLNYIPFALSFGFIIGYYDGFFGPGTGTFFVLAFMFFRGYNLRGATMRARMLNFASNLGALLLFALGGKIIWSVGLLMASGQFLGARLGASMVMKKGTSLIRPLIICVSVAMSLKLLLDLYL